MTMTYGAYKKLSGKDVKWEDIQTVHDEMHKQAVATCHDAGMPEKVCDIKMIVKICTEKEALIGDLLAGEAPWITIGWKVDL